ncbi:MAG: MBL fold metallo-hydrolase [Chloroflexota bacterium]
MKITFLGTGAAQGIPAINCDCEHCTRARSEGGKLARERSAVLFSLPGYELLADTPPDVRILVLKNNITHLDGILVTSSSYDHIGGIKEFEYWRENVDFLAEDTLFELIKQEHWTPRLEELMFHVPYYPGASLYFGEVSIVPFAARQRRPIFGFSIKEKDRRAIYTSDTQGRLTNYARHFMRNCDLLIVNTPAFEPPAQEQITVVEALRLREAVGARRLILTHIDHLNKPHDELERYVRQYPEVAVAYDGMVVEV